MQLQIPLFFLLGLCFTFPALGQADLQKNDALIFGELQSAKPKENFRVQLWKEPFEMRIQDDPVMDSLIAINPPNILKGTINPKDRDFTIQIPGDMLPAWISFEDPVERFSYGPYLISPGDSIKIKFDQVNTQVLFGGPSRHNFEMAHQMKAFLDRSLFDSPSWLLFPPEETISKEWLNLIHENNQKFRREVVPVQARIKRIEKLRAILVPLKSEEFKNLKVYYEAKVPEHVFNGIISETYSKLYQKCFSGFYNQNIRDIFENAPELIDDFTGFLLELEQGVQAFSEEFDPSFSPTYLKLQEVRMRSKAIVTGRSVLEVSAEVEPDLSLREAVLTAYFLQRNVLIANGVKDFGIFLSEVQNSRFRDMLEPWYRAASPGLPVPPFPFLDSEDNEVSITDFKGKVVLIETWLAGCVACKYFTETHLTRLVEKYKDDPDVVFVSVSLDRKRDLWDRYKTTGIFVPRDVLHLWTGRTERASSHPYLSYFNITSAPQLQLVDREGRLTGLGIADLTFDGLSEEIERLKRQ